LSELNIVILRNPNMILKPSKKNEHNQQIGIPSQVMENSVAVSKEY